jgi:hypothetical protein
MSKEMIGKRFYPDEEHTFPNVPGEYMKGENGRWELCMPTGIHGAINDKVWKITEHEDGTITVSPSIDCKSTGANGKYNWHGWLEKGVWREC